MYLIFGNKITVKHIIILCFTVVTMFFLINYFMMDNEFIISSISFLSDDMAHGTSSRFVHVDRALLLFADNLIFGLGRDGYLLHSGGYKTHNIILTLMTDNGIVGLFLYVIFCFVALLFIARSKVSSGLIVITLSNYLVFIHSHADGELLIATPLLLFITCIQLSDYNSQSHHDFSSNRNF
jgi:O-antigen ligase